MSPKLVAILIPLALLAFSQPMQAQSKEDFSPSCWFGSVSFSPGTTVRAGGSVMVCAAGTAWEPTTDEASGCLFDGKFFSVGSIHASFSAAPPMECQTDGTWKAATPR
jgi:hypothetical protein